MDVEIHIDDTCIAAADSFPLRVGEWLLLFVPGTVFLAALMYTRSMFDERFEALLIVSMIFAFAGLRGLLEPSHHVRFRTEAQDMTVSVTWPLVQVTRSCVIPLSCIQSIGVEEISDGWGDGGTERWVVVRSSGAQDGTPNKYFPEWRINKQRPVALWQAGDDNRKLDIVQKMTGLCFESHS